MKASRFLRVLVIAAAVVIGAAGVWFGLSASGFIPASRTSRFKQGVAIVSQVDRFVRLHDRLPRDLEELMENASEDDRRRSPDLSQWHFFPSTYKHNYELSTEIGSLLRFRTLRYDSATDAWYDDESD